MDIGRGSVSDFKNSFVFISKAVSRPPGLDVELPNSFT
jgi:hypothetical protein